MNTRKIYACIGLLFVLLMASASNCKKSSPTTTTTTTTPTTAPGSFSITSTTATIGQVAVSWGDSSGATSYTLKYGTTSGTYSTTFSTSARSPATVTGLTFGTTYYFMVTAVNSVGTTNASSEASSTPLGGMNCYDGFISEDSTGYYLYHASSANPISYLTNLMGNQITRISFPLSLQDPSGVNTEGTAYSGSITLNVYSCVAPGAAPSTGTLVGSAVATYDDETGGVFALSTTGAGTQGDMTNFSFSSSPIAIPTSCSGGKYQLALEFTGFSGFASEYVLAPIESASSTCFLNVSGSSTTASSGTTNAYQAIITVE